MHLALSGCADEMRLFNILVLLMMLVIIMIMMMMRCRDALGFGWMLR